MIYNKKPLLHQFKKYSIQEVFYNQTKKKLIINSLLKSKIEILIIRRKKIYKIDLNLSLKYIFIYMYIYKVLYNQTY
jgi:hypothetical protein